MAETLDKPTPLASLSPSSRSNSREPSPSGSSADKGTANLKVLERSATLPANADSEGLPRSPRRDKPFGLSRVFNPPKLER